MKCSDSSTWPEPSTEHRCEDAAYGSVRVRAWAEMHPKVLGRGEDLGLGPHIPKSIGGAE
jgi:hypothetical protein